MNFLTSSDEFEKYYSLSTCSVNLSKSYPSNIFIDKFKLFLFITFDEVRMGLFFNHLKDFCRRIGEKEFVYMVLDPDPKTYYFDNFGRYNAIIFSVNDTEESFIAALNDDPGDSPADCMMDNSNQISVTSVSKNWIVFADRGTDIAVCAFANTNVHEQFESAYGDDLLPDVKAAANYAYGATGNSRLIEQFYMNYKFG